MHRREHKRDPEWDVLGHVSLIREIDPTKPHRAHLDILADLHLAERLKWMSAHDRPQNFDSLLAAWRDVLNTEELNRRFYRDLFQWFERAVEEARFPTGADGLPQKEEHVIRLITRLLFVWFIKEKGLVAEELFIENQAKILLKDYDRDTDDSYYRTVLQNLFFATLNTEIATRRFSKKNNADHRNFSVYRYKEEMRNPDTLLRLFNKTPFINGGLFDCLDSFDSVRVGGVRVDYFTDNPSQRKGYSIPNHLFFGEHGLIDLLNHYKFTVEENTPVEQEVALDPELLGKVFENLLAAHNPETKETARKQTGSYYTPRDVVDYMADEALVASLSEKVQPHVGDAEFWQDRLRYLLDYTAAFDDANELFTEAEAEDIVQAIAKIRVLDPAVGSGAFPMGILHKLTLALRRLDPDNQKWESLQKNSAGQQATAAFDIPNQSERNDELTEISDIFEKYHGSDFGRKLYLIQNSIYGVDIQPIATQIAKLRFFISLAIEQRRTDNADDNYGIKPLPNLETRFVVADTLLTLDRPAQMTLGQTDTVITLERELAANRERHFHASSRKQKLVCRHRDAQLRRQLAEALQDAGFPTNSATQIVAWNPFDQSAPSAHWFDAKYMFGVNDGFDVVIGNPPYAKSEHLDDTMRKQLRQNYGWSGDLYDYFIFAGFDLVSEKGVFSYIANDSYVTLRTKRRIRDLFLQNRLLHLVKSPAQTFEASIYTAIFVLLKCNVDNLHTYSSGEINFPDFKYQSNGTVAYTTIHKLPDKKFLLSGKNNWVLRLLTPNNMERFLHILDTGVHSGNVRSKIFFKDNNGNRHRLLQGRQIQRFALHWDSPAAKYRFCDVDYQPLPIPGIGRGGKPSRRNEYWHFCGDIKNHHQPERLLMRQTDDDLVVTYHSETESGRFYTDNTLFTILSKFKNVNLKYFLALFNSRLLNFIYHFISQERGKNQAQVKIGVVNKLPVIIPNQKEQSRIIAFGGRNSYKKSYHPEWGYQ